MRGVVGSERVLVEGRWVDNPRVGDERWACGEARPLWGELGDRLGIGPPPEDF
jgi:hypothetical protein